jgi:cytoskeletal protein CcmA (bactofilin family)
MFSKSRINEPGPKTAGDHPERPKMADAPVARPASAGVKPGAAQDSGSGAPRAKVAPSVLSSDLVITGNLRTTGDIQVDCQVEGDIRAHLLTVGESATIKGEVIADDVIVNGRVIGKVRGLKVRLTSSAQVEGDIIHKTIAIESGAHFEGSVQRQDDPLGGVKVGASARAASAPARSMAAKPAPMSQAKAAGDKG